LQPDRDEYLGRINHLTLTTMKKIRKTAFIMALGSLMVSQSGCFGEFALVRKVYTWNKDVSGSKFVQTLLFYAMNIIPVYGIAAFVDVIILNLIEFWSGSNPVAMNEGDYEMQLVKVKGVEYKMEATKDTFTSTQLTGDRAGEVQVLKYDRCDNTWKVSTKDVQDMAVMTFLDGNAEQVRVYTDHGSIDLSSHDMADAAVLKAKFEDCELALAR